MEKSPSIKNIAKALVLLQTKMQPIAKDSTNPFFKSKYCSLSNIIENIQIPLSECDLSYSQFPDESHLTTILMHGESGEYLQASYLMPVAKQSDPQSVGSAITYARRYALGSILGLNIEEDDDANKASRNTGKAESQSNSNDTREWLNIWTSKDKTAFTKEGSATIAKLESGAVGIETVEKHYKLSKEAKDFLLTKIKK